MRVIIVGAGEVGYHVAERLVEEQHDVVVVDVDGNRLEYVQTHVDAAVVEGSGTSPDVLREAGIDRAGLLLAVTSVDEVNLVCTMSVPTRPGLVKVARVSNPDFYGEGDTMRPERFGVDLLINPERELALETMRLLKVTAATDVAEFADGAVQFIGLIVTPDAPVVGRTLASIGADERGRVLLTAAIERAGDTIVPTGQTVIAAGDHLYVVAAPDDIGRALALCGHTPSPLRRVMLAGGSREAYYLARLLQQHHVSTVLLVDDRDRARELAERLEGTLVLQGSGMDVELMELEGVGGMDAFVALGERDEQNILAALGARHAGTPQVITLVNKQDFLPLGRRIGLDTVVSPRLSAANAILRYVRRGSVTRVATLRDSRAEGVSLVAAKGRSAAGQPLAEVTFPDGALVAAIVRGRDVIIPRGTDALMVADTAIVFALPEAVPAVTRLFPS